MEHQTLPGWDRMPIRARYDGSRGALPCGRRHSPERIFWAASAALDERLARRRQVDEVAGDQIAFLRDRLIDSCV
jgi:hypothetical protein